jgi:hypothetical protein
LVASQVVRISPLDELRFSGKVSFGDNLGDNPTQMLIKAVGPEDRFIASE